MQQGSGVNRQVEERAQHPVRATAIPPRYARERARVLGILARWSASVDAQALRSAPAR